VDHGINSLLYGLAKEITPVEANLPKKWRYIVNHTKREFVNKLNIKGTRNSWDGSIWKVHPLPLLTCEGNGRGGGDYHGNSKFIGVWARNVISIEETEPVGYKEINPQFKED
jgi:hypothetical protein